MSHNMDLRSIRSKMDQDELTQEIRGFVVSVKCSCGELLCAYGSKLSEATSALEDAIVTHLAGYAGPWSNPNPLTDQPAPQIQRPASPCEQALGYATEQ